jgi:sec-independent protein translocase protein TatA
VGTTELVIVLVIVLLVFGGTLATRLPKMARSIGQSSNEFKKGMREGAADDDETSDTKKA